MRSVSRWLVGSECTRMQNCWVAFIRPFTNPFICGVSLLFSIWHQNYRLDRMWMKSHVAHWKIIRETADAQFLCYKPEGQIQLVFFLLLARSYFSSAQVMPFSSFRTVESVLPCLHDNTDVSWISCRFSTHPQLASKRDNLKRKEDVVNLSVPRLGFISRRLLFTKQFYSCHY